MFYLQTNDGERFLTNAHSDDKAEFAKIIENKMGKDSVEIFNDIVDEAASNAVEALYSVRNNLEYAVQDLDRVLNAEEVDRVKLEQILSDIESIYTDVTLITD